ncbi:HAMP domain-containing protein [Methylobacterium sp. WL30]|jgi:signal transduction histidine kinase|uniref:sensor histidine kinase n=1 Tax=unclassified Methylobacterium TaxID=2615210 RepID=UPI0011C91CC4|nr:MULTISPECIES: ATP-binding protein [unclassified Methylobacterium]MCJ2076149.1 ATP-binding protein [Methylobacterium sp. E-016]TXM94316.1 HAMP domain-containing protein [Methylobacterium sp. WL116]TXN38658.1 HAMP domain-containing protein [Methylobacterium sp. WL93]TXN46966.1 HAMP domain-containing protein [Methylobacterium sp. WL119]TXN64765.1 HAMP domain-containing protein [Methylobacterium sp. WL30]
MRSLKVRFALLLGSIALVVVLAAAGVLAAIGAAERTIDRTLAAQGRLELLAELSGRMTQFGMAAVETIGNPDLAPEAMGIARSNVDRALTTVDEALSRSVAGSDDPQDRMQYALRSRPMAQLRAARVILDRQVAQIVRQTDPEKRQNSIKGALNGFGAMTGQPLSFLIEAERRSMVLGSDAARDLSQRLRIAAALAVLAALGLVVLLWRSITRPTLARIEAVRRAAGAIGGGKLDTRLSVATRDELGLLVANVNRMAARLSRREGRVAADRAALEDTVEARTADLRAANARLEAVDRSRRRFFADVSHELRTPLTVILGECDLAARAGPRITDHAPAFATIRKRAMRLKLRVEDLLRVARSESGEIELDRRALELAPVLAEAVDNLASEGARRRVALAFEPGPRNLEVLADREWLRQVVESLIDNALRHATGLTRVEVALSGGGTAPARITVTDDGPGFGDREQSLFERFRRGDRPAEMGFGIGLALARWLIEQHDGTIVLGAGENGAGARVTLEIPLLDLTLDDVTSRDERQIRKDDAA